MGDFLKNAGIVGLNYMLDMSDAESGKDYGIKMQNRPVDGLELYEQGLWLDEDFVQQCDWTGMYFDACVNYYGDFTVYKGILDRINKIICKIDNDQWKPDKLVKEDKEDIKFINDKLLSNSYKAGFENIRNEVDGSEIYVNLQQNKLNAKSTSQELKQRFEGIKNFIMQPKCKETFVMKSVRYNYINRFWDGKCFLLRANAKKDMRILFEQDFTKPFKEYIRTNHDKDKDMCIDCGRPMGNKERVSIAFMKDMADDLARKKSAFWNCKVDAFLCPACAFVYAASPLGFTLLGQRFAFMNTNSSINQLLASNSRSGKIVTEAEKKEAERYTQWFARMLKQLMDCKVEQLNNIQVILKGTDEKDKYIFSVISNEALQTFNDEKVRKALEYLGKYPYTRIGADYLNIYENVVMNINAAFIEIEDKQKCYYSIPDNKAPIFFNEKNNPAICQGDRILVKVITEPLKTKPAKVSSKIELTGNYSVVSNDVKGVHISKKIKSNETITDIKKRVADILIQKQQEAIEKTGYDYLSNFGIILRSGCADANTNDIIKDVNALCDEYTDMLQKAVFSKFYTLVHKDRPGYIEEIVHLSGKDSVEIITDIPAIYNELETYLPRSSNISIRMYKDELWPLYKLYSIEKEIDTALSKKVWLKSGGYLIIEQTEALSVIDVNSGKNVTKAKSMEAIEASALKTNLEAADKLCQQIKIRNLSGIIIVDFINMNQRNCDILMEHLKSLAKKDIVNTTIVDITKLGLVEITRKKIGKSLSESLNKA